MYSASQIAAALNKSKRGVLFALASSPPSGRTVVSGNSAWAWRFDVLPGRFKEELAQQAKQRGYAGPEALLSNPPPIWSSPLPLKHIAPHHLERATQLQRALKPFLEQTEHTYAQASAKYLAGIETVVRRARFLATKENRAKVLFADIKGAIQESAILSDSAPTKPLSTPIKPYANRLQEHCRPSASSL